MNFIKRAVIIVSFLLVLTLNIQIVTSNNNLSSDGTITISGIELSLFTPVKAGGGGYDGHFIIGPCGKNCIGSGWYCWQCHTPGEECSASNAYCADN